MQIATHGQDWGPLCWTPVEDSGWLTDCTMYLDPRVFPDVFRWSPLGVGNAEIDEDDDREMRVWAATARQAFSAWASENPY